MNANRKPSAVDPRLKTLSLLARLGMLLAAGLSSVGCMGPSTGPRQAGTTAIRGTADSVRVWSEQVTLPTYAVHPDPVPRFQVTDDVKYYPYSSQRDIDSQSKPQTWTAVCMENRYLKVTVMPELGGRLFAMYDKLSDREVIYRQKAIKPGRVGIRGAWICGGIEYDFPDSHSVTTHDKVHWTTRQYPDGSASILVGDVERISRMGWTVEFRMAADRASMADRIYLHNRTPMRQRYYYWTNAGIEAGEKTQMILPFPKVTGHFGNGFADWPMREGVDWSWFWKYPDATSTFGIGGQESFIGAYDHDKGTGIAHYADKSQLPGRKFWTWGVSPAGMRWYDVLSDDKRPYAELQAGPMLTQSLYAWMQPYESQRFEEFWIPISRIGPFARVNPEAAVRLTMEKDEATVGVLPMRTFASAQVDLCAGQRVLQTWKVTLAPETPLLRTVKVDATDAASLRLVVRDSRGQSIIEHTLGKYALDGNVPTTLPTMDPQGMTLPTSATADPAVKRYELQWLHCDYSEAARTIEDALSKWPDDPQVRFDGALFRLFQGQPAKAVELLQPLVNSREASPQAKYYLALAKMQTGESWGASRLLADVRTIDPKAADATVWTRASRMLGAKVLLRAGRFSEVRALLEPVLKSDPDYPYATALCIYAARREGRKDVALQLMREHLLQPDLEPMARLEVQLLTGRTDPTLERMLQRDPEVAIELACDYTSVGGWGTAEAILVGACGENAKSGMTWLMAGWCAAKRGEKDKAAEYRAKAEAASPDMVFPSRVEELAAAEQALQAGPASPRAAYYAGLVLMRLMRYDEAIACWERAVDARDDNGMARRSLAMALSAVKKDKPGAIAQLERAIAIDPRQPVFYQDLADLYSTLGRPADARDVLARAVRAAPVTDALVTNLAEADLSLGQYREATQALADHRFNVTEGRYGVHDDYAVAWAGVGLQAFLKDDPQAALSALNNALEYPENLAIGRPASPQDESMIHYWRGVVLQQLGKSQEATQAFELSVKQASGERGGRRSGFYGTVNTAHSVLAMRALGRVQAAASQVARLTRAPSTNRWMQGDWYRSFMAFRGAWAQVMQDGAAVEGSLFDAVAADPQVPGQWPRLSVLLVEALRHRSAAAVVATQPSAASGPAANVNLENLEPNRWVKLHEQSESDEVRFQRQEHGGGCFDARRGRIVLFGSNTHGKDWTNSPLVFDVAARRWVRLYADDGKDTYLANAEGLAVAGEKGDHPWAMHTFGSVAYDPERDEMVVCSEPAHMVPGRFTDALKDVWPTVKRHPTWTFRLADQRWVPLACKPMHFFPHAVAWDSDRQVVIGYGGAGIWELGGQPREWKKVGGPALCGWHNNAVYDSVNKSLLVFGSNENANDMIAYRPDGGEHRKMPTPGVRPPQDQHAPMCFDVRAGKAVVIVDQLPAGAERKDGRAETWLYDLAKDAWTAVPTAAFPFALGMNYNMYYDANDGVCLLVVDEPVRSDRPVSVYALRVDVSRLSDQAG